MKKKILIIALAVALLVVASVGATLAYLTSTDTVTNTFTVGNVKLTLDEADTDELGDLIYKEDGTTPVARVKANEYHLIPGEKYVKDPTVTVEANSEDCYLFVKIAGIEGFNSLITMDYTNSVIFIADGSLKEGWSALENVAGVYYKAVTKATTAQSFIVFSGFSVVGTVTGEQLAALPTGENAPKIVVNAYAIQQAGFGTAADAWAKVPKE